MARTPLFDALRFHLTLARIANRRGAPPPDELVEMALENARGAWTRRRFLRAAALTGAALGTGGAAASLAAEGGGTPGKNAGGKPGTAPGGKAGAGAARIAIVGGGVAGLNAAHVLRKAGVRAEVYEASTRTGGRMHTATGLVAPGITTELGGEFIDTSHEDIRHLARELGLELLDTDGPSEKKLQSEAYFFDGKHRSPKELVEAFRPLAAKMAKDTAEVEDTVDFEHDGHAGELNRLSIAAYLNRVGASGWLRQLLDVAFVTEYGLESGEQSSLNLLEMIETEVGEGADAEVKLLGESDERYKIKGGNQRVVDGLADRLEAQIHREHRLVAVAAKGQGYTLSFERPGGTAVEVEADFVVLALPFTLLRQVDLKLNLPEWKRKAIAELGYGTNAKVLVGVDRRVWRDQGHSGNIYSDEPFQLAWDSSRMQPGTAGGVTLYSGGKPGVDVGQGTAEDQALRLLPGLEKAFPGVVGARNGKVSRFHWPSYRYTLGSYAAYRPGQWTSIRGAEGRAVGRLLFAGEHTSLDWQGFMNGGAESGRLAAEAVLKAMGRKAARPAAKKGARLVLPASGPDLRTAAL